ncbi:MAG: lipoyl(octanoyl) transferase LipB [Phycisphaerales bacterium]
MSNAQPELGNGPAPLRIVDLGRMPYEQAYDAQCDHRDEILAARSAGDGPAGVLLLVEHNPPVITISKRPTARTHLLAGEARLAELGVTVAETDRGGDITYHGPGQLVVYPILDLNRLGLNLHAYMRALEAVVIDVCRGFGVEADRDADATGVWVGNRAGGGSKICAMGVRVRRWVTMHGLALNVTTDLSHFGLIVPCGLQGRPVTSLANELGDACPTMDAVKDALVNRFRDEVERRVAGQSATADA